MHRAQASTSVAARGLQLGQRDATAADSPLRVAGEAALVLEEEAVPEDEAEALEEQLRAEEGEEEEEAAASSASAALAGAAHAGTAPDAPLPPALAEAEADALAAAKRESRSSALGAAAMVGVAGLVATTLAVDLTDAALVAALITAGEPPRLYFS